MKLKKKYQLLLLSAIVSVPLSFLLISVLVSSIYDHVFKTKNEGIPFHASFAYPTMLVVCFLSFLLLAFIFSKSIHSVLNKINIMNKTIRHLASSDQIPNKLEVTRHDEIGELIGSVNLLIERTTYRELELKQQEENKKELLNKLRHDINTPLTAVRLQLFYLEGQHEDQVLILESLYQQIQYIADLTNELKLQSTDTLDHSYIVSDEVNIHVLLETMVKKWSYLYSIHDMDISYHSNQQELIWTSNELWLQRLFDNIFQNALKHSQAQSLEVTIQDGMVSIRDNGVGFDMESKSVGLGLKIIQDIAKSLRIECILQSDEKGTRYLFRKD